MKLSDFQCLYLDIHCSEKSIIYNLGKQNASLPSTIPHFIVSTCLRHEIYTLAPHKLEGYAHQKSKSETLIRLFRVMCGLESEIIGEPEILYQAERGIRQAFEAGTITRDHLDVFLEVIALAETLREKHSLTSKENYSTIAAKLFDEHLEGQNKPTIMVVGAGYMSRLFLDNFNLRNVHMVWVNRNLSKISKLHGDILNAFASYTLVRPEELPKYGGRADAIFAAVSNYPSVYDGNTLTIDPSCLVVDISYPVVFKDFPRATVLNLENTHFSTYASEAPSSTILASIQHDIDKEVQHLLQKWG